MQMMQRLLAQDMEMARNLAAADILAEATTEKFRPFPWRNVLNSHTTNRAFRDDGGVNRIVDSITTTHQAGGLGLDH